MTEELWFYNGRLLSGLANEQRECRLLRELLDARDAVTLEADEDGF